MNKVKNKEVACHEKRTGRMRMKMRRMRRASVTLPSDNWSMKTDRERRIVTPSVNFSPDSGGRVKPYLSRQVK